MASAALPLTTVARSRPAHGRFRLLDAVRQVLNKHLLGVVVWTTPLIALAFISRDLGFVSNFHANAVAKDLLAWDRGRLEFIGFVYPPAPFLIGLITRTALGLSLCAATAGGVALWLLWRDTGRGQFDHVSRLFMVGSVALLPQFLYIAVHRIEDVLVLYLLIIAWHRYLRFINSGQTAAGFAVGLVLGLGFFINLASLPLAIAFGAMAPLFVAKGRTAEDRGSRTAVAVVVMFPAVMAFGAWAYMNWLFTGKWLFFVTNPASPLRAASNAEAVPVHGLWEAVQATASDVSRVPFYVLMAVIVATYGRRRVIVYAAPVLVIIVVRWSQLALPSNFAIAILAVLAAAAVPRDASRRWVPFLVGAATLQIAYGWMNLPTNAEETVWINRLEAAAPTTQSKIDQAVADRFARVGHDQILADDTSAFALVALTGTARPFVLPADAKFQVVTSDPVRFVDYVLVADPTTGTARAGDSLTARYGSSPPKGFIVDGRWPGWILFRRLGAASLLSAPSVQEVNLIERGPPPPG